MTRRRLLNTGLACLLASSGFGAQAMEPPPHYAVLSLIGAQLNVVVFEPSTGSNIQRNAKQAVPIPDRLFDGAALQAIQDGIKKLQPQSGISLYANSDSTLVKSAEDLLPGGKLDLPKIFLEGFMQDHATHLVLVTRRRGEANLKLLNGEVGEGRLEGVGYYVDPYMKLVNSKSGNSAIGLMAAYTYLRVTLIDLKSREQVASKNVELSYSFSAADRAVAGGHVWDSISAQRKIEVINEMIATSIEDTLPKVIPKN